MFEHDAKSRRLTYYFDGSLEKGAHQLRLEVKDAMNNVAVFDRAFRR